MSHPDQAAAIDGSEEPMVKRWRRVSMDAGVVDYGGAPIIRITRGSKGDAMASVEHMQWFEPDGDEYTGYVESVQDRRRPAGRCSQNIAN